MNKNVAKALIFMAGSAFGAIISAFATKKVVEKVYWDECDKELNEQNLRHKEELKAYKDKIEELESTISQQNVAIAVLGKKVSEENPVTETEKSSDDDPEDDPSGRFERRKEAGRGKNEPENEDYERERTQYWRESEIAEDFFDEDEVEFAEEREEIIEKTTPYVIDKLLYETTAMDFYKEDAKYYIYDGKVVDADSEWMENYAAVLGEEWLEGNHKNGEKVFVRNEYYQTDYEIEFVADYGERHINVSISDDVWED